MSLRSIFGSALALGVMWSATLGVRAAPGVAERAGTKTSIDFRNTTPGPPPSAFAAVTSLGKGTAKFTVAENGGRRVLTDTAGAGGDILYYKAAGPQASIEETYSFTFSGPDSIVEPFIVNAHPKRPNAIEGFTTDLAESHAGNNFAGNVSYRYLDDAGRVQATVQGRLRTEPYFYQIGHSYRVDAVADGVSGVLTTRVYDVALGPQTFDVHIGKLRPNLQAYPGIIVRSGPAAIRDFAFGPAGALPMRPIPARRAWDYANYLGYNAAVGGPATSPVSLAFQRYFPQLLIKHVRVPDEPRFLPSINAVARYGIDADVLTGNRTTLDRLRAFIGQLALPPDSIELWNEPNNPAEGAAYDAQFANDLPAFAAQVAQAFHGINIWGPSVLPDPSGYPSAVVKLSSALAPVIAAWNTHSYTQGAPENLGYGGFFSNACGTSKREDCGWYGSPNYNDNLSATIDRNLPGVATEGAASYGSYPDICGHGNVDAPTQQAYVERGMLYNFKLGHLRIYPYKFIDDGGCTDGFGSYGIMSKILDPGGQPTVVPKPAYTSLVYFDHILADNGSTAKTFQPLPLEYSLTGAKADLEEVLLAESDGSYRLILWSDAPLWDFNANGQHAAGSELPLAAEHLEVTFAKPMTATVYSQTPGSGIWQVKGRSSTTSIGVTVNQYPLVVAIAPKTAGDRGVVLPQGVPTPGPVETPRPKRPVPPKPAP
ncbi:MAG: hypothetical protein M3R53_00205 [Candidatus Eremiobacteraeota bacterium]|nr:hypothetical protein [Candidatus Eremiobacteraeota bacterium]